MSNKVIFVYGCMSSGKSSEILRLIHSYHEQSKNILVIKPAISARESDIDIVDRAGESYKADVIEKKDVWHGYFKSQIAAKIKDLDHLDMVVADEAQFLEPKHVIQLHDMVHKFFPNTPIMLFGLLKNFRNQLFGTSKFLVEYVDDIRELKAVCWYCNSKATRNIRLANGHPVYSGKELSIGGNESYRAVCRYHYYHLNKRRF